MNKFLHGSALLALLAGLAGCDVTVSSSHGWSYVVTEMNGNRVVAYNSTGGSSWFDSNLKGSAKLTQGGAVPADLTDLEVDNKFGSVKVTGVTDGPMEWSWQATVRAPTDELAQAAARDVRCTAVIDHGRLRLTVAFPVAKGQTGFASDLAIRVPARVRVQTTNQFGDTEIADVSGGVEAGGQSGAITVRQVGGAVHAETTFGAISVAGAGETRVKSQNGAISVQHITGSIQAETAFGAMDVAETGPAWLKNQNGRINAGDIHGRLEAETSFGSLTARRVDGAVWLRDRNGPIEVVRAQSADLKTSFGAISATDIGGDVDLVTQNGAVSARGVAGSVRAENSFGAMDISSGGPIIVCHSQNGALLVRATSPTLSRIEARTSFGAIDLTLPSSAVPAIEARTTFGHIESDFPVLMKPRGQDPFAGLPEGTARIQLESENGGIHITRAD